LLGERSRMVRLGVAMSRIVISLGRTRLLLLI
jgi:hypothetical protein